MSACMAEGRSVYRIFDPDPSRGCHAVASWDEADAWSSERWGIFWTVNEFVGPRKIGNCKRVISWAIDLDEGTKDDQKATIRSLKIDPSAIIETSRGFHVYFNAIDADPENYRDITERLVQEYKADQNAKDLCRLLRVPGYCHWKNPERPFAVVCRHLADKSYTEAQMRSAFPREEAVEKDITARNTLKFDLKFQADEKLWDKIYRLDCEEALKRLSGSEAVRHEMFSFKRTSNGNLNILVNGNSTSCWIDGSKRIGSSDNGGPTIWQWVNWYQRDHKKTYELLKKAFPEVFQ